MVREKIQTYIDIQMSEIHKMLHDAPRLKNIHADNLRYKKQVIDCLEWYMERLPDEPSSWDENVTIEHMTLNEMPDNTSAIQRKIDQSWEELEDSKKYYDCTMECDLKDSDYRLYMDLAKQEYRHASLLIEASKKQINDYSRKANVDKQLVDVWVNNINKVEERLKAMKDTLHV